MHKFYYVALKELPITAINKLSLDPKMTYSDDSLHSAILNINGRLCQNVKFGILTTKQEAENLLNYWRLVLDNRNYGDYEASIESIYPTKWQKTYAEINLIKFQKIKNEKPSASVNSKFKTKKFPTSCEGQYIVQFTNIDEKVFYVTSFKKSGGFRAVNFLEGASLYSNKSFLQKQLAKIKSPANNNFSIVALTPEQYNKIENSNKDRY
jgi:hypothetical protein